jgi:hypothetical protein
MATPSREGNNKSQCPGRSPGFSDLRPAFPSRLSSEQWLLSLGDFFLPSRAEGRNHSCGAAPDFPPAANSRVSLFGLHPRRDGVEDAHQDVSVSKELD